MKKLIFFSCLFVLFQQSSQAGDGDYAVWKIPPALFKNANAVIRVEETHFEIFSTKETVLKEHYVITILNEKGDQSAMFSEWYNKSREIESIEGFLYDANGKELKKMKKKDAQDMSGVDDNSLIDDNRYKKHNFYYRVYPYTIEYFVKISNRSTLFFPMWSPQEREGISVETSIMTIEYPQDYKIRYKSFNYKDEPVASAREKTRSLTWTMKSMPAIWKEVYSPRWYELTTVVIFGPTDFQMEDYKGNMVNWQDFGKFVYSLKEGRDQLPDPVKQSIHSIADPIKDPKEKIAKLYEYMQKNTRYISIQLGIGGWQPFEAKEVASKGYGDCKALANYMYSILKEEGIPSYYSLVRAGAGEKYITTDFPSQQFNHVILCVPLQNDTMWLECTSQTMQPGYLGDFTCDRPALLIDETGGKLVRTPCYKMNDNLQTRHIKAILNDEGTLNLDANSRYGGLQQDYYHDLINFLSKEKVKEKLHEELDFATYDINKFSYLQEKASVPAIDESLDITVSNYATITGKRLFILPNVMNRSGKKLNNDSTRKYDIEIDYEYKDVDSVEIELPKGYITESMPEAVSVSGKFGNYASYVRLTDNKLFYYRSLERYSGHFPASAYDDLVKFYETIYKSDRRKVVLVKN